MEILTLIGAVGTLASSIVGIWRSIEDGRQKELDREHSAALQRAQHDHERLILSLRQSTSPPAVLVGRSGESTLINRLEKEAEYLVALNFDVVFEDVGSGYAIALPLSQKVVLVLWLSLEYPRVAPRILTWADSTINEVEFSPGSWNEHYSLAEVVSALAPTLLR